MNNKWDKRLLNLAKYIADWSKDPSTKCGAIIADGKRIVSVGFNGFPAGTVDSSDYYEDREEKLRRIVHAEVNAMAFANRDLSGCTIYVWPMHPCSQCAAQIIQHGISRVVTVPPTVEQVSRWHNSFNSASNMFRDAGIEINYL